MRPDWVENAFEHFEVNWFQTGFDPDFSWNGPRSDQRTLIIETRWAESSPDQTDS